MLLQLQALPPSLALPAGVLPAPSIAPSLDTARLCRAYATMCSGPVARHASTQLCLGQANVRPPSDWPEAAYRHATVGASCALFAGPIDAV